jgi:predicted ATP-grasp superfamily ATP-dependent carboligase
MAAFELPPRLLVVSCSARMLVRSAARAGLRPVALDLYADADTRECVEACEAVAPGSETGFDGDRLIAAAERLAPALPLVYGSGMDVAPDLLARLARGREVYGNPPELLQVLRTPETFFDLLRRLDISHPETRFSPPQDPANWLIKSGCSEGGKGVRFCAHNQAGAGDYFQRRLPGPPLSALFLADGEQVRILGFNTLWTASHFGRPFLFVGAVNRARLGREQREQVRGQVETLVRALGLKGLNSLDFMVDGAICRVLEINPRPSATLGLYDADFPEGLLAAHIRACRGRLDVSGRSGDAVRAFAAVFAARTIAVPEAMVWPEWCADRPVPGSVIEAGQPLCTVEAEGREVHQVEALIAQRKTRLESLFPEPARNPPPDP